MQYLLLDCVKQCRTSVTGGKHGGVLTGNGRWWRHNIARNDVIRTYRRWNLVHYVWRTRQMVPRCGIVVRFQSDMEPSIVWQHLAVKNRKPLQRKTSPKLLYSQCAYSNYITANSRHNASGNFVLTGDQMYHIVGWIDMKIKSRLLVASFSER